MATSSTSVPAGYVAIGPKVFLDRLLDEYGLTLDEAQDHVIARENGPFWIDGVRSDEEWLIHESLLRSHSEFPCAGDEQAVQFCRAIVEEMVTNLGVPHDEAVARINRQWSDPEANGTTPRVWIVGLDIAYHDDPDRWARHIYYGHDSYWWRASSTPTPLPPPD